VWVLFDRDDHPAIPEARRLAGKEGVKVAYYLRWCDLWRLRSQTGQPLITQGAINGIGIPRFALAEQQRIVWTHQAWDEKRSTDRQYLSKLRSLRSGIIDDLFNGKVRSVASPSVAA
jgi:hypothetical protein